MSTYKTVKPVSRINLKEHGFTSKFIDENGNSKVCVDKDHVPSYELGEEMSKAILSHSAPKGKGKRRYRPTYQGCGNTDTCRNLNLGFPELNPYCAKIVPGEDVMYLFVHGENIVSVPNPRPDLKAPPVPKHRPAVPKAPPKLVPNENKSDLVNAFKLDDVEPWGGAEATMRKITGSHSCSTSHAEPKVQEKSFEEKFPDLGYSDTSREGYSSLPVPKVSKPLPRVEPSKAVKHKEADQALSDTISLYSQAYTARMFTRNTLDGTRNLYVAQLDSLKTQMRFLEDQIRAVNVALQGVEVETGRLRETVIKESHESLRNRIHEEPNDQDTDYIIETVSAWFP